MKRDEAKTQREAVLNSTSLVTERKTKVIDNNTYNIGIAFNKEGASLNMVLLQLMKDRQKYGNLS